MYTDCVIFTQKPYKFCSKSNGRVANDEIDGPMLHSCLTQLPEVQAFVEMVLPHVLYNDSLV